MSSSEGTILSKDQQKQLNIKKVETRIENEKYLRRHPELSVMIREFSCAVLKQRPEDIELFAAEFFTDPDLEAHVLEILNNPSPSPTTDNHDNNNPGAGVGTTTT